ncbi:MAG TPA: GDSL-type esterase/lipase family protein [Thermoanaerobaculia bacterium]
MRRLLYWYVPLVVAIAATAVFAAGFYSFVSGDVGTPVDLVLPTRSGPAPTAPAQQSLVTPIILGDSLARGAGDTTGLGIGGRLDQELRRRNIHANRTVNIAINGARAPDVLRQLQSRNVQTILAESNVIILSVGGNDLWGVNDWRKRPPPDKFMDAVLDRVASVVDRIRAVNPRARIFFIGLYNPFWKTPAGGVLTALVNRWNAKLIERFGSDVNLTVVQTSDIIANHNRLAFDQFHPGDEGYALIARRIADAI